VLFFRPREVAMSRLDFLFPTITLIAPTCWGVRGVV